MEDILTDEEIEELDHWSNKMFTKGGYLDKNIEEAYAKHLMSIDARLLASARAALLFKKKLEKYEKHIPKDCDCAESREELNVPGDSCLLIEQLERWVDLADEKSCQDKKMLELALSEDPLAKEKIAEYLKARQND